MALIASPLVQPPAVAPMARACLVPSPMVQGRAGWLRPAASSIHAFLPQLCKCLVMVGGRLAREDTLSLVQTSTTCGQQYFLQEQLSWRWFYGQFKV